MKDLTVLTFADKPLSKNNHLKTSCEENKLSLEVLICSPWVQNIMKLKMLFEYLISADPELVVLVVDAYDVVVYAGYQELIDKFYEAKADVLFSGESNFMYKEPAKWLEFLRKYPQQPTIYQYLNSGTYMGQAKYLKKMLVAMQKKFNLNLLDEGKLLPLKSDQYLLSRFYVEHSLAGDSDLKLKVDSSHTIFGVTGGRFCVFAFPDLSKWQAFSFFIVERNMLKAFGLHMHQKIAKDYLPMNKQFYNKKTDVYPLVMHFPGTWDRFDRVYEDLLNSKEPSKKKRWAFAFLISFFSFLLSIMAGPLFWMMTMGNYEIKSNQN